jgi:beta-ureidopropionase
MSKKHHFELKAYKVTCAAEQLRAPRVVRVALIQNMIAKPTSAPVREQFEGIRDKVEKMIDAAG